MKKAFFIFLLLLLGIGIGYLIFNPSPTPIKELNFAKPTPTMVVIKMEQNQNDFAASFGIFTLGTARTFNQSMYHNLSPEVYIEKSNSNLVHVKKPGVTWDYFFKTLPFLLTKDCLTTGTGQSYCSDQINQLKFYINGIYDPNALERVISPRDNLLVSYGPKNDSLIKTQLQQIPIIK